MTVHAIAIGAAVFITLGVIQLAAIGIILFFTTRYQGLYCASHIPAVVVARAGPPG
jgi:hypothetical protein